MDLKEKELLLKDLSSRLFYNPWVQFNLEYGDNGHKEGSYRAHISSIDPTCGWIEVDYFENETWKREWSGTIEQVKPYLRPMSSITKEEREEIEILIFGEWYNSGSCKVDHEGWIEILAEYDVCGIDPGFCSDYTDWLLEHHFDIRGLIEKGLALEALKGMY